MKQFIADYGLVIGLLLGALLQTATGLLTDWRASKRARKAWLLEKRYAAYTDMAEAINAYYYGPQGDDERLGELLNKVFSAEARSLVIADKKTRTMLNERSEQLGYLNSSSPEETSIGLRAMFAIEAQLAEVLTGDKQARPERRKPPQPI